MAEGLPFQDGMMGIMAQLGMLGGAGMQSLPPGGRRPPGPGGMMPPPHWLGPPQQKGGGPLRQPGPHILDEEAEPDPLRAAALVEMGKFMTERGKMHHQRIKLRDQHQAASAALRAARPQGRY